MTDKMDDAIKAALESVERIENDTRRNFWLNAEEAKEYGLLGKIVRSIDEVK